MPELPNFGYITTSKIEFEHVIKFAWWCHGHEL